MAPHAPKLFSRRGLVLLLLAATLSIAIPLAVGGRHLLTQLQAIPLPFLGALLLLLGLKWQLNALRCRMLLAGSGVRIGHWETLKLVLAHDFASEGTPGAVGGPVAGYAFLRRLGLAPARIASLGFFMLLLDLAALAALLAGAFAAATAAPGQASSWQISEALLLMALLLALLWALVRHRRPLIRLLGRHVPGNRLRGPRSRALRNAWLRAGQATERLAALPRGRLAAILALSAAHWACRLSVLYVAILATGFHAGWVDAFFVQFIAGVSAMLVALPGGYLGADATVAALLLPRLDLAATALVVLLWRLLTFHLTLVLGGLAFLALVARPGGPLPLPTPVAARSAGRRDPQAS